MVLYIAANLEFQPSRVQGLTDEMIFFADFLPLKGRRRKRWTGSPASHHSSNIIVASIAWSIVAILAAWPKRCLINSHLEISPMMHEITMFTSFFFWKDLEFACFFRESLTASCPSKAANLRRHLLRHFVQSVAGNHQQLLMLAHPSWLHKSGSKKEIKCQPGKCEMNASTL